jgi:hypothetical protein
MDQQKTLTAILGGWLVDWGLSDSLSIALVRIGVVAVIPEFDLRVFQQPSGYDMRQLGAVSR